MGEPGCDLLDSRNANADDSVPHVLCLQIFGMCRMPVPLGVSSVEPKHLGATSA